MTFSVWHHDHATVVDALVIALLLSGGIFLVLAFARSGLGLLGPI
jgi:hypothetical protein